MMAATGAGSRLDKLVQIGHNPQPDRCRAMVSRTGMSDATVPGAVVVIGRQAGLAGHTRLGCGARLDGRVV